MIPLNFPGKNMEMSSFECYILFMGYNIQVRSINWKGDCSIMVGKFLKLVIESLCEQEGLEIEFEDFEFYYMMKKRIVEKLEDDSLSIS